MDISGFIRTGIQSLGNRVLNWLTENGVEVRVEYHAGDVHYQRVLGARRTDNVDSQRREGPETNQPQGNFESASTLIRLGAAVGSAMVVGTAVAAAGMILAAPQILAEGNTSQNLYSEGLIESRCSSIHFIGDESESCPVCMENFIKGETIYVLPCLHKYHRACVMPWLLQTGQCSVCRFNVGEGG